MERSEKEAKLIAKVQKKFAEFTNIVDKEGDSSILESQLLTYAKHREDTLHHRSNNVDLTRAKETVSELNSLYTPTLEAIKLKSAYLHLLLKDLKTD